jgi:multisite-specific tRNA:(cytosine-C5)-methyltransferase
MASRTEREFAKSLGHSHALAVQRLLVRRYIPQITNVEFDGQLVPPPQPVPWYPDSLAWWMTTPKNVIRKFPPFSAFQRFLVSETNVGNISRQELVSMIPPLLLDVRPGMAVLDMCAAPGSKAAQLLEMLHAGEEGRLRKVLQSISGDQSNGDAIETEERNGAEPATDDRDDGRATGILIANDSDYKRCHLLTHQLKRFSSPNLVVTQHDATTYPPLRIPNPDRSDISLYLKFDRILTDVPCSGDGTLRKNPEVWKQWTPGRPIGLYLTQVRILVRALQMLKVGGRVVYSTCSMNPIEDEAVVASAIDRCGGPDVVEIIDCHDQLPGLQRRRGLTSWPVMDKSGRMWKSWKEIEGHRKSSEEGMTPSKIVEGMFPPSPGSSGDAAGRIPLERCTRLYAHLQDTGAFFIAVLELKAKFKAKPEATAAEAEVKEHAVGPVNGHKREKEEDADDEQKQAKRVKMEEDAVEVEPKQAAEATPAPRRQISPSRAIGKTGNKIKEVAWEEPFKFLPADKPAIQDVIKFYGISKRFPTDRYMVRNALAEPSKTVYYTSALVRDILQMNEGRAVKFVHAGVRMFVKQESPSAEVCRWRIQSEGIPILQAYVGPERIVVLRDKETLRKLLVEMFYRINDGAWEGLGEIGPRVRDMQMGCFVLRVEPRLDAEGNAEDEEFSERMVLPLWKSFMSINVMLPKEDRSAMLLRIFNDTTPLVNIGLKDKKKQEAGESKEEGQDAVRDEVDDPLDERDLKSGAADGDEVLAKEEDAESHIKHEVEDDGANMIGAMEE